MQYKINAIDQITIIIPDIHEPYSHKDAIPFLRAVKEKHNPTICVNLGDEVDYHAISFHDSDSSLPNADAELDKAIIYLQEGLHKLWPKMYLLESNHGSLAYRRFKHHGLPIRMLKPLNELYETPEWSWHHDILLLTKLGPIYLCHGKASGYGKLAMAMGCSAIQGHFHGKFEITWHRMATGSRFNAFCGCLVDYESMAMAYGRNNIPQPVLGCMIIDKDGYPQLIKMKLDIHGNWIGEL